MKVFKIYSQMDEYVVLQCPKCGKQFRSSPQDKVFGNERKNARCQKCEELFDFNSNQLDDDSLPKTWNSYNNKEMIKINPDGSQEFFQREKSVTPDLKSADKLD